MKIFKKILAASTALIISASMFSCTWEEITITPDGSPIVVPGETGTVEKLTSDGAGGLAFSESAEGYIVTGYHGTVEDVFIPRSWNGRPVVGINSFAFYNNDTIATITITSAIKSIGKDALIGNYKVLCESHSPDCTEAECENEENKSHSSEGWHEGWYDKASDPSYVEWDCGNVGSFAWETIPNSTSTTADDDIIITKYIENPVKLTIPEKIANRTVVAIKSEAFMNCDTLESITLPSTIEKIGSFAFQSCTKLKSIKLPDGVTVISSYMFRGCVALESVEISSKTAEIASSAFADCPELKRMDIPSTVSTIGSMAFLNDTKLKIYLHGFEKIPETWNSNWNLLNNDKKVSYEFVN